MNTSDLRTIDTLDRWGLLPERSPGEPLRWRAVLRHWFVRFNPLYFVSACCVLYGVFLVNRNLDGEHSVAAVPPQLALFGVLQAYEALIIAGAVFLVRVVGALRPAVLLALLECVLLFDCTFRLESLLLADLAHVGVLFAWLALTVAKVWALAAALRVPLEKRHYAAVIGAAAALGLVVYLLVHPATNTLLVLQGAAWIGALVLLALDVTRSPPPSALAETVEQRVRAARCVRGAFRIVAGAYFFHVWSYIALATDAPAAWAAVLPQAGTFFLRSALVARRDTHIWRAGLLLMGAALSAPVAVPYAAFLVAAIFAYRVRTGARSGLAAGAAIAMYAGITTLGWTSWADPPPTLPPLWSWPTFVLAALLILVAAVLRDPLAGLLVGIGAVALVSRFGPRVLPKTEMGRGALLVAAGFLVFLVGLVLNWWLGANGGSPHGRHAARRVIS